MPAQLPVFVVIVTAYVVLLHRSVIGRALYAIGFTARGARYAAIPVARRVALVYVLSGLIASVAAIIYVAHLGQARSDAGTRLRARCDHRRGAGRHIGLRRARHHRRDAAGALRPDRPADRTAPGRVAVRGDRRPHRVLLLATIAIDRHSRAGAGARAQTEEEFEVKNSQVAVLCATILAGRVDRGGHQRRAAANGGTRRASGRRAGAGSRATPPRDRRHAEGEG